MDPNVLRVFAMVLAPIAVGIYLVILGGRGFMPQGISLTKEERLTSTTGQAIGVVCIALGIGLIVFGMHFLMRSKSF